MPDQLHRFTFENFHVRGEFVSLAASWRAVLERHDYPPTVRQYLGQAMVAATLLSATIKFHGSLILQIQGSGPLRTLVAQATEDRMIRGMAHAVEPVPAGDLGVAFGDGHMALTAESARGQRYQGIVALEGGSLAALIERYFEHSEQLPTRVWLAANHECAAGLLLQRLPGTTGSEDEDWRRVGLLAETLTNTELLELEPNRLLHRLFHEEVVRLYEPEPVAFRCNCSRERIAVALRAMGVEELQGILREHGAVEADCEFCNAHYSFDAVDVAGLFAEAVLTDGSAARH